MILFKAFIYCETCRKEITGEPMSNKEDAEQLTRIDHRRSSGHWALGEVKFSEVNDEKKKR